MPTERLQKLLAGAGVASRRAAERLILDGRVRVNGRIVRELGVKADPRRDRVEVDGTRLAQEHPVYFLLHKPRGVVTTLHDPEGRPTVGELLRDVPERVFPVGRLDFHTSGALLLTNDGEWAQALLHPKHSVPRVYSVKLRGALAPEALDSLRRGVPIGRGEIARPTEVAIASREAGNTWLRITLAEGKNREVHRMLEAVGRRVARLARVSFAGIDITGLPAGAYRELTREELWKLQKRLAEAGRRAGSTRDGANAHTASAARFKEHHDERTRARRTTPRGARERPERERARRGRRVHRAHEGRSGTPTRHGSQR